MDVAKIKYIKRLLFLLEKYAGGKIPILLDEETITRHREADIVGYCEDLGLIPPDFLKIYHHGTLKHLNAPIGILMAPPKYKSIKDKWNRAVFYTTSLDAVDFSPFCRHIKTNENYKKICNQCDRDHARLSEEQDRVIAYCCPFGLIDIVAPIKVRNTVVGVVLCGQFKPAEGPVWNNEMMQANGVFHPLDENESGIDIWNLKSVEKTTKTLSVLGLTEEDIENCFSQGPSLREANPDKVKVMMSQLEAIASQISLLATKTYELEKTQVMDWIRDILSLSVEVLPSCKNDPQKIDIPEVWSKISRGLKKYNKYFGFDYSAIFSIDARTTPNIKMLLHDGLPASITNQSLFSSSNKMTSEESENLISKIKDKDSFLLDLRDLTFSDIFKSVYRYHKKSKIVLCSVFNHHIPSLYVFMISGTIRNDIVIDKFLSFDVEIYNKFKKILNLIVQITVSIDQLQISAESQLDFIIDVAHEIRTPIQNIIVEGSHLKSLFHPSSLDKIQPVETLMSQARKLHHHSERVWTLTKMLTGRMDKDIEEMIVFDILSTQRKSLLELAHKRGIEIIIDKNIQNWEKFSSNYTCFSISVSNLLDNAVKYADRNSTVHLSGSQHLGPNPYITLIFNNIGIGIADEEKEKIFERFYRANNAKWSVTSGTGIGLAILKTYLDLFNGEVEVTSIPKGISHDTTFKIKIPDERRQ